MKSSKLFFCFLVSTCVGLGVSQQPMRPMPNPNAGKKPAVPAVATTIPPKGIHLNTEIGAFKIKRGSEALNYGSLEMTFKGTVLVSGLNGTAVASNGAELEFEQPKFKKKVFHSKGSGVLKVQGQFGGIQFFGQNVSAYYRGDGVIQLFGEFDKNLNTGTYWYDQNPTDKRYWGTSGQTITPAPFQMPGAAGSGLKIKDVTGKG